MESTIAFAKTNATTRTITRTNNIQETFKLPARLIDLNRCEGESPTLVPLPVRATPFTIITYSDNPSLRNRNLHPRDKRFYVDIDRNDEAHCSLEHLECTRSMNFTVFNPDSSLAVQAPGGQQTYIKTDGTMSFTEPQESAKPDMLYEPAGTAYQGGGFIGPNGTFWAACDDGTGAKYVVAVPGDETGAPDGCERLNLWTMKRPQGTWSFRVNRALADAVLLDFRYEGRLPVWHMRCEGGDAGRGHSIATGTETHLQIESIPPGSTSLHPHLK